MIGSIRMRRESGSALLVVIVLLSVMVFFVAGNGAVLHNVKQFLNKVEQRHQDRIANASGPVSPTVDADDQPVSPARD